MKPRLYKTTWALYTEASFWVCSGDKHWAAGKTFALAYAAWKNGGQHEAEA